MKTIGVQRVIAGLLVVSGAWYALITWTFPLLWPGYVVWGGWVAVACGQKRWQEKWFWIASTGWNAVLLALFVWYKKWGGAFTFIQYWYPLFHLALAVLLSTYLMVIVPWDTWPENRKA